MISQEELLKIDGALTNAVKRLSQGVPLHREMTAEEIRPIIRAAIFWRLMAHYFMDEQHRAGLESMSLGPVPEKYAQKQEQ